MALKLKFMKLPTIIIIIIMMITEFIIIIIIHAASILYTVFYAAQLASYMYV